MIDMFLYDDEEQSQVQFVGFVGEHSRYDLMLIQTDRHYGKTLVLNMQNNKFGIIGTDDIEEEGYIAHILGVTQEESDEIIEYLNQVINKNKRKSDTNHFSQKISGPLPFLCAYSSLRFFSTF